MQILLVDDNESYCLSMKNSLALHKVDCDFITNGKETLDKLERTAYKAVLIDIMLGNLSGIDVLKSVKEHYPQIPVLMITGYGTIETAIESIKFGAFDYIQKPIRFEKLIRLLETISKIESLSSEKKFLKEKIMRQAIPVISRNPEIRELIERSSKLAQSNLPILITGENGTGKELFAQHLHLQSQRGHKDMVTINCAALAEGLLDNELFGHEKGAYTGADKDHTGVLEKADNNTLFLDEIGDMSLTTQAKILRVIQNQEIRRIGSNKVIKINVNIIAATNKNLEKMIEEGTFREDLYYRLKAAHLKIPPLRSRGEDILLLAAYFLEGYTRENRREISGLSDEVQELFLNYPWPGNIRELKNCIHYSCTMASGSKIEMKDLPADFLSSRPLNYPVRTVLESSEKDILIKTLQRFHYNKSRSAEHLNISRSTLYNKMLRYNIDH